MVAEDVVRKETFENRCDQRFFLSGVPEVWAAVKSERPHVSCSNPASAFVLTTSSSLSSATTNWLVLTGGFCLGCHRRSCQAHFCGQCCLSSSAVCSESLRRMQREARPRLLWAFFFAVIFQRSVIRARWLRSPDNAAQLWIPCFLPPTPLWTTWSKKKSFDFYDHDTKIKLLKVCSWILSTQIMSKVVLKIQLLDKLPFS